MSAHRHPDRGTVDPEVWPDGPRARPAAGSTGAPTPPGAPPPALPEKHHSPWRYVLVALIGGAAVVVAELAGWLQ